MMSSNSIAIVLAVGVFGIFGSLANAADYDQITISAPSAKVVGHDAATGAAIEKVTATGRVSVDPVTLTTHSGVALLRDAVQDAAQKLCDSIDPLDSDSGECVRRAVESAQAQIAAAVARANAHQG